MNPDDYKFERHHISDTGNDRVPRQWVYMIRPPDDSVGGIDFSTSEGREAVAMLGGRGFVLVTSKVYDEFLRSRRIKYIRSHTAEEIYEFIQMRYDIQHARVALVPGMTENELTWGEWEEFMPSSWGDYTQYDKLRWRNLIPRAKDFFLPGDI